MKNIAILTSGGDSPGMNAAIRAIVRAGIYHNRRVFGIYRGYDGLIDNEIKELTSVDVSNIIQRGGTILKSARSERFMHLEFRKIAFENLQKNDIDGLIVLGGDGTFKGASIISSEFELNIVGIPCTIDNDLFGTDFCIGYDTAINTAMEAIDKSFGTKRREGEHIKRKPIPAIYQGKTFCSATGQIKSKNISTTQKQTIKRK